jgi:DNA ligase (NAD+)
MDVVDIQSRMAWLRAEITRHDRLYYVDARPEISDVQYDALWDELVRLEHEYPQWLTLDSPTQRVSGAPIDGFTKVRHDPPMKSLDKTYDRKDLLDFDKFLISHLGETTWDYVVEPKIDGLSLSLLYRSGQLVRAATRGNGEIGDDITANVRTIRSIPLSIPCDAPLVEVRGEIYMTREGFASLNREEEEAGREPFANPRNAAAGSIKLLDPREVAKRPLDAIIYAAGALNGIEFDSHTAMMRTFAQWGFKVPQWQRLCMGMEQVFGALDELEAQRHRFAFEIDGAVIKINQRALYRQLGSTAHAPRFARAYKYAAEEATTRLLGITVQVGRTGVLTPVAELQPVSLAGSVISRATLHNQDYIDKKDIRIGDMVVISKHGDVIPAVDRVESFLRTGEEKPFSLPMQCPVCGSPVQRLEDEVAWRCLSLDCPAQRVGHLQLFVARSALDISAIGGRMAEALVETGRVKRPLDLYDLDPIELAEFRLISEDGSERRFGKKASDVVTALERARTLPLHRWLYALGIPGIGETHARTLTQFLSDLETFQAGTLMRAVDDFYSALNKRPMDDATRDGIVGRAELLERDWPGIILRDDSTKAINKRYLLAIKPEMAKRVLEFLKTDYASDFFARMERLGICPRPEKKTITSTLAGLSFVITGTLSQPRETFESLIREQGGVVASSVTKKTSYVLVGANPGGSKFTKAQTLGTPLLQEADFMALLAGQTVAPEPLSKVPVVQQSPKPTKNQQDIAYIQDDLFGGF